MRKWTAMAGGVLVLAAAACGSSAPPMGGGSPSATTTAELITSPQPYGEVIGGRVVINIAELMFQPDELEIPEGTTVIWTNNDRVPHAVAKTSGPGPDFNSGPILPGGTYQQIFPEQGTVRIEDTERPDTTMVIKVVSAG